MTTRVHSRLAFSAQASAVFVDSSPGPLLYTLIRHRNVTLPRRIMAVYRRDHLASLWISGGRMFISSVAMKYVSLRPFSGA